jgi:hypothetical protein
MGLEAWLEQQSACLPGKHEALSSNLSTAKERDRERQREREREREREGKKEGRKEERCQDVQVYSLQYRKTK